MAGFIYIVGYQMETEDFLHMFGVTVNEAARRARALNLPSFSGRDMQDEDWAVIYRGYLFRQSGTKLQSWSVKDRVCIFGLPLTEGEINFNSWEGAVSVDRLITDVQAARDQFMQELGKMDGVCGHQLDLSAVRLCTVLRVLEPLDHPAPRLYEWEQYPV